MAGVGITLAISAHVQDEIARGTLVSVLKDFCVPFPGYSLYYPQRRQASRALSAFAAHVRVARQEKGRRARR